MEKIEVYYDPSGFLQGKTGCYKARRKSNHGCWGAGDTQERAKLECTRTAKSFGKSGDYDSYELIDIGEHIDNPGALNGIIDIVPWHHPGKI